MRESKLTARAITDALAKCVVSETPSSLSRKANAAK
jgi:hypothetical protein